MLILGFRKSREGHTRFLACEIAVSGLVTGIRYILFLDPEASGLDLSGVAWLAANNIDPVRDCFHYVDKESGEPALYIDATKKTAENDHFSREWPNVIIMDDQTIREIDNKWPSFGLGPLLPSPSIKFKSLVFKTGAVS
jgi:4-hydroxy-3-polyprenylbenzoate decarboxylase